MAGVLLLSVVLFRLEWFQLHNMLIHLFVVLLISGLGLIFFGFSKLIGFNGWYGVAVLVVLEVSLGLLFQVIGTTQIRRMPGELKHFLSLVYTRGFMNTVQFDSSISHFDPKLQYLFKPGTHNFSNLEFENALSINSVGLRDDEESLENPKVVFLGDSYTMGWGVEKEEAFEMLFEKEMQVSCLNTGVSSYGTAREYLLLDRLSLDSCKLMFIQYCANDLLENYMLSNNGRELAPQEKLKEAYELYCRINILYKNYYPFKHVYWLIRGMTIYSGLADWLVSFQQQDGAADPVGDDHGIYLSKILRLIRDNYQGEIVFYHLDAVYPEELTRQLEGTVRDPELNIHWLDMSKIGLQPTDYFLLDPHINVSGHRKVADALVSFVRDMGISYRLN